MTIEGTETVAPTTQAAPAAVVDTDAAALSAAREAMGRAEPAAVDAPAGAAGAAPPGSAPAGETALQTEMQQLRAEIKARETERKDREKLDAEYGTKLSTSLAAEKTKLEAQVRAQLVAEYKENLRLRPVETIRDFGVDGSKLVMDLARRAGPAGEAHTELEVLRAKLEAVEKASSATMAEIRAEREAEKAAQQEAATRRQHEASAQQLVTIVTEKAPAALAYYGNADGMMTRAQAIAKEYCEAKGVDVCPYGVIVQELESETKAGVADRVKALEAQLASLKSLQQPAGLAARPSELNGRVTGSRTLSASGASERRASPKPPSEMTADEADAAMRAAAREAMGPVKKSRLA